MSEFTHLHVHTQYSILDGAAAIKKLLARAKELGMTSLAITDHGNMFGVKEFHNAAHAAGIKPILGCEVYVAARSRFDKTEKEDRSGDHLILLAKNLGTTTSSNSSRMRGPKGSITIRVSIKNCSKNITKVLFAVRPVSAAKSRSAS